jgi:ankyrin
MDSKHLLIALITAGFLAVTAGCKEKTPTEKMADKASKTAGKTTDAIKDGVKKAGDSVEKAYDKSKDAVKDGAQATGDAVKQGVEKTGDAIDKAGEKFKELGK